MAQRPLLRPVHCAHPAQETSAEGAHRNETARIHQDHAHQPAQLLRHERSRPQGPLDRPPSHERMARHFGTAGQECHDGARRR